MSLPVLVALLGAATAAVAGRTRPRAAPAALIAAAGVALAAVLAGWRADASVDASWVPTLGVRWAARMDDLGAAMAVVAAGIGLLVAIYSAAYLPAHLAHEGRPAGDQARFHGLLGLFLAAMLGLATAQDLIVLVVFFDVTAVASYFLIGFDHHRRDARESALLAIAVTGIPSVLFLAGALLLALPNRTFSIPELAADATPSPSLTAGMILVLVAAAAKSAQLPLHFWLPRAMVAPTPVSAYLHSAAMVAAGAFVLARLQPLVARAELGAPLAIMGFASAVAGGVLALAADELKRVLAYSTVAQYGHMLAILGLARVAPAPTMAFYLVAHALAKSALFLAAGAVTQATGEARLSRLGGLGRSMPGFAAATGISAAALAGLPLTSGFWKDEVLFAAALEHGPWIAAVATLAAALSVAYTARFFAGIFLGAARAAPRPVAWLLAGPAAALAALALLAGLVPGLLAPFAPAHVALAYHADARPTNLLALAAWGIGGLTLLAVTRWRGALRRVAAGAAAVGPDRAWHGAIVRLDRVSDALHRVEVRDLRDRVVAIVLPAAVLAGLALLPGSARAFATGPLGAGDWPQAAALVLVAGAALSTLPARPMLALVLTLSSVGYALAALFAVSGAPDVALVAVGIQTVFTLLFVGALALLPRDPAPEPLGGGRTGLRHALAAGLGGTLAFVVVWRVLSTPAPPRAGEALFELAPSAHGLDAVTVVLADFRGLDTMGEITVVVTALVGIALLLARGRRS